MARIKSYHPPKRKTPKSIVNTKVDLDVVLTLKMLGFDIPALVQELLSKVAGEKKCPCCGRAVRPVITGRKWSDS